MCAAPEYLDRRGRPRHPSELKLHDTMMPPSAQMQRGLLFQNCVGGEDFMGSPRQVALTTSSIDTKYAAALHGFGIAGLPSFVIGDALMEGALETPADKAHAATQKQLAEAAKTWYMTGAHAAGEATERTESKVLALTLDERKQALQALHESRGRKAAREREAESRRVS